MLDILVSFMVPSKNIIVDEILEFSDCLNVPKSYCKTNLLFDIILVIPLGLIDSSVKYLHLVKMFRLKSLV